MPSYLTIEVVKIEMKLNTTNRHSIEIDDLNPNNRDSTDRDDIKPYQ